MWKFVLNHGKAKGSIIKLYRDTCGSEYPLPDDPKEITKEMLE